MSESETRQVKLVRRWGSHQPGETVDVDKTMADWLTGNSFAERSGQEGHARANARAEGTDGPDNRAGGDVTRRRMTSAKSARLEQNLTGRVQGAPRPVGDVSHVAPENLGKEHKGDGGDVLLASGKTLRQDLEDHQAELDEQDRKAKGEQGGSEKSAPKSAPKASGESPEDEGRKLTQKPKG